VTDFLAAARAMDDADPLADYRRRFVIDDTDLVYFDGNSLGRLPVATRERLVAAVSAEWGGQLIRGWDGWLDLARRAGDVLATGVLGVSPGEVTLADSTTVNLYKLAAAALDARPDRRVILTDDDNFPTDRYVLAGLAAARGLQVRLVPADVDAGVHADDVAAALDQQVALVCLSHVAYRSGARADVVGITAAAHAVGALTLWDLSHSAGSIRVPLREAAADLAVGCTYKYLNAGPGAPAFLYVRADLQPVLRQPIWGWFGQRDQFAMAADYDPADTIEKFTVGTPSVLGGYAVLEGASVTAAAGVDAIAAKGAALTSYAIGLCDSWLAGYGFAVATPRDAERRGAHITLRHARSWQICQALRAVNVIPDFRLPDRLRIGLAPLYTRFVDVFDGLARLREVMRTEAWRSFPTGRTRVT
jgi:kynureninase